MIPSRSSRRWLRRWIAGCLCLLVGALQHANVSADPPTAGATALPELEARDSSPPSTDETVPEVFTRATAIVWALQNNPELAALRQQHGIAAAAVIIAETYPFNPVWEGKIRPATGPASAGITNVVSNEHKFLIDVELRGQGTYRRQGAYAAMSRTDWEIAFQEELLTVRVIRTFDALLYRRMKLALMEEAVQLNEQTVKQVLELRKANKLTAADLLLARTEVDDARAMLGTGRTAIATALTDLRRALGSVQATFAVQGALETPVHPWEFAALLPAAFDQRADLHARQAALAEAEARVRLEVANRYGNPNVGPAYEYDPTRINLIGAQITLPMPLFNRRRGEIEQRQAERVRAALDLRQTEIAVQQDVQAALDRLRDAHAWADTYRAQVVPHLQEALKAIEDLFSLAAVDVLRVIDVRRKLIRARDGYLDALWEVRQAQADLAAAVADPSLAGSP